MDSRFIPVFINATKGQTLFGLAQGDGQSDLSLRAPAAELLDEAVVVVAIDGLANVDALHLVGMNLGTVNAIDDRSAEVFAPVEKA